MSKQLQDIVLDEVSVVDKPANEDAVVALVKANPHANDEEADMADKKIDEEKVAKQLEDAADTITKQSDRIAELEAIIKSAGGEGDDEEFDDIDPGDLDAIEGLLEDAAAIIDERDATIEKMSKDFDELKKSSAQLVSKVEKMGIAGEVIEDSEIFKGASPEFVKRFHAMEAVNKARELDERIEKARGYGFGNAKEVAEALAMVEKRAGKETADKIEGFLKTAATLVKKAGALRPIGSDGVPADSPIAKAKEGAAEIRKAQPELTEAQAISKYWSSNPEAYAEYRENRAA